MAITAFNDKLQIYRSEISGGGPAGTTAKKRYIYKKDLFDKGGLWCSARDLSQNEIIGNKGVDIKSTTEFKINRNKAIIGEIEKNPTIIWVEFKNKTYNLGGNPDNYDFISPTVKFQAEKKTDSTKYSEVLYAE